MPVDRKVIRRKRRAYQTASQSLRKLSDNLMKLQQIAAEISAAHEQDDEISLASISADCAKAIHELRFSGLHSVKKFIDQFAALPEGRD